MKLMDVLAVVLISSVSACLTVLWIDREPVQIPWHITRDIERLTEQYDDQQRQINELRSKSGGH